MKKCDCYQEKYEIVGWFGPDDKITKLRCRCNGTQERDECTCGGDRSKCDFYPEARAKATKDMKRNINEMRWNVMLFDYNQGKTAPYNVFNNASFSRDVQYILEHSNGSREVSVALDRAALYSFSHRCEYEFIVSSWPPSRREEKISVYDQLKANWDRFVDYVLNYQENTK
jgi:hypothetical protein